MNTGHNRLLAIALSAVGLLFAAQTAMATTRWDMNGCNPAYSNSTGYTSHSCTTNDPGGDAAKLSTISAYASGTSTGATISNAYIGAWNLPGTFSNGEQMRDVGVVANNSNDASSPQHSMDNSTYYDSLLLSFSDAVKLTEVQLGWRNGTSGDSDLSVLVYTGKGLANPAAAPVLTGKTYASLLTSGWELVGNFNNVWNSSGSTTTNESQNRVATGSSIFSSYWLVAAFNPVFIPSGTTTSASAGSSSKDYVKLLAVYGDKAPQTPPGNQVPEPSSVLLLGVGLAGLVSLRRRKTAR